MSGSYTLEEVAKHNKPEDCWIIISGKVYDVTKFLASHPGGKKPLTNLAGKDATKDFMTFHDAAAVLRKYGDQLCIGAVGSAAPAPPKPAESKPPAQQPASALAVLRPSSFGNKIPYADPVWYQEWHSPYFNESHIKFRAAVRDFVEKEIEPFIHEWDEQKALPKEIFVKAYKAGMFPGLVGPPWQTQYAGTHLAGGIKPEEYDAFHEMILIDELSRPGSGGLVWGLNGGLSIGLPPILLFGSKYLQDKVAKPCLSGEKFICLSITEPGAGSDVSNIQTVARKSPCGKFYIVNGEKKWMTGGVWADYFTVAVRTGEGAGEGVSLLLIEREMPGVTTRHMPCSGMWASGTAYVTYEEVKVPVENLIGKENKGFKYIMYNFNHERWGICVQAVRFARVCVEEAFKYAHKRKTFGKRLIDHPVIRLKLGHMIRQVEASQSWLDSITYQLTKMSHDDAMRKLGGPISLLKAQCTQTFEYCAREAFQIFGGLAYTRGSQGQKIERLYREVRAFAIAGGSEEIMLDFGVRQAMKYAKL